MKGFIIGLALVLSSTTLAEYSDQNLTSTERRHRDSVSLLQQSFIDLVYGFSFDRIRPMNSYAIPVTQRRFLFFLEETWLDYGARNFQSRMNVMFKDLEQTLNLTLSDEVKTILKELLIDHALPAIHYGNSRCTLLLDNES